MFKYVHNFLLIFAIFCSFLRKKMLQMPNLWNIFMFLPKNLKIAYKCCKISIFFKKIFKCFYNSEKYSYNFVSKHIHFKRWKVPKYSYKHPKKNIAIFRATFNTDAYIGHIIQTYGPLFISYGKLYNNFSM